VTDFVLNEWIWEDVQGRNSRDAFRQAISLIEQFASSSHRLIFISGSRFDDKAWQVCNARDPLRGRIARIFVLQIRQVSARARLLHPSEAPDLPEDLAAVVDGDDHYLVRAQLAEPGSVLVSTDGDLLEALRNKGIRCMSRDDFFKEYFPAALT
jgi:hypothetical protein